MSHIFEIIEGDVELKIQDKTWKLVDPSLQKKVLIQKELSTLMEKRPEMSADEYLLKFHEINKKQIMMFLPGITEEYLDQMGDSKFQLLLEMLSSAAELNFGAKIEKKESIDQDIEKKN